MFTRKFVGSLPTYLPIFILFLALVLPLPALAEGKWFSFGDTETPEGTPPVIKVLEDDSYHTTLEIIIPGMWVEEVNEGGYTFQKLEIPDFATIGDIGKPAIPAIGQFVGFLEPSTNSIEFKDETKIVLDDFLVYPAQTPRTDNQDDSDYSFEFDKDFYSQDVLYPKERANASETMIMREVCVTHTGIVPFEYNPAKRELVVHPQMLITVYHKPGADGYDDWSMPIGADPDFVAMYRSLIVNYDSLGMAEVDMSPNYDYIIITNPLFRTQADSFSLFLNQNGHRVKVEETSANDWHQVYDIIYSDYQNYHNDYVLLIGDTNYIPAPYKTIQLPDKVGHNTLVNTTFASDMVYACLTGGDVIPEIAVGRFSANNPQQVQLYIDKVKDHYNYWDPNRVLKCLLMANKEDRFWQSKEEVYNHQYSTYHPILGKAYGCWEYIWNKHIIGALESGLMILNFRGHGSEVAWTDWNTHGQNFDFWCIDDTKLGNKRPVIFSIACLTGSIDYEYECFGEHWMNVNDGAVAFIGASVVTYTPANSPFDKWLFRVMYDRGEGYIGIIQNTAKLEMLKTLYGGDDWNYGLVTHYAFLLLGDPSLWIIPDERTTGFEGEEVASVNEEIVCCPSPKLMLYPNPVTDKLTVNLLNSNPGKAELSLYDLSGRKIKSFDLTIDGSQYMFTLNMQDLNLNSGVYILKLETTNVQLTRQVVFTKAN